MRRFKSVLAFTALAFTIVSTTPPSAYAEKVLQGEVCLERVHELTTNIGWHKNLDQAEAVAAEQGKLVFWVHMVGKIDGAT